MSMLAEARRKQKWSLNPRGKQWSSDTNKFGQKMLEKMGWSSGKGLGKNEQGTTHHIHVSLKNDMGGIGYKDTLDQAWTEHQDSFNDFLKKLQQDSNSSTVHIEESKGELSGKSLELKSKQSRARVHYKKFTRGKDVNKYSSKDLANIFGQKELHVVKDSKNKSYNNQENSDSVGSQDSRGGVITINSGSIANYFKQKGQNFSIVSPKEERNENALETEPEYPGLGIATFEKTEFADKGENRKAQNACNYAFENPCIEMGSPETSPSLTVEFKPCTKRKRNVSNDSKLCTVNKVKKFKETNIIENGCKTGIVNAGLNLECQVDDACNGKEFEISRVQFGVTNVALDLTDEAEDKKRVRFNDHVEYSTDSLKCKKNTFMLDKFEVENKKTKKKRKRDRESGNSISCGFINEALDVEVASEEVNDNEVNERKSKKCKKRKESHRSNLETIVEMPEETKDAYEEGSKVKRAKMEVNTVADHLPEETVKSKKVKKKRKEKEVFEQESHVDKIIENETILTHSTIEGSCEADTGEVNVCKKKTKKKKKSDHNAKLRLEEIENNVSESKSEVEGKESLKVEFVQIKKKKKSKKEGDVNDINIKEVNEKDGKEGCSGKENRTELQETETKTPKKKKDRKPVSESVSNNSVQSIEPAETSKVNTTMNNRSFARTYNGRFNHTSYLLNNKTKLPRTLMRTLFQSNILQDFPGSNIYEMQGYGVNVI